MVENVTETDIDYVPAVYNGRKLLGYRMSSDGFVWSRRLKNNKVTLGGEWKRLKSIVKKGSGHTVVFIRIDGKDKCLYVHRLMLESFVGPCPDGMECCHYDGNPQNNAIDNLRWDHRKGNGEDRVRHGITNRGEKCPGAKLTADDVKSIRNRRENGERAVDLVKEYGISYSTIMDIIHFRRWSWLR